MVLLDFVNLGSSLRSRNSARPGLLLIVFSFADLCSSMLALDFFEIGLSLASNELAMPGSLLTVFGA